MTDEQQKNGQEQSQKERYTEGYVRTTGKYTTYRGTVEFEYDDDEMDSLPVPEPGQLPVPPGKSDGGLDSN